MRLEQHPQGMRQVLERLANFVRSCTMAAIDARLQERRSGPGSARVDWLRGTPAVVHSKVCNPSNASRSMSNASPARSGTQADDGSARIAAPLSERVR